MESQNPLIKYQLTHQHEETICAATPAQKLNRKV